MDIDNNKKHFGFLLIFDCKNCNPIFLKDKDMLQYFIDYTIKSMNMKPVGNTIYEYFPDNDFNISNDLVGFSITQIISMSSITIHICEISRNVYIDIFTCCDINDNIIIKLTTHINKIFNPETINHQIIKR